jgi:hypothetical protein
MASRQRDTSSHPIFSMLPTNEAWRMIAAPRSKLMVGRYVSEYTRAYRARAVRNLVRAVLTSVPIMLFWKIGRISPSLMISFMSASIVCFTVHAVRSPTWPVVMGGSVLALSYHSGLYP